MTTGPTAIDARPPHWAWFLLPLAAYASTRGLWAPDEPRYAQVALEMVQRADYLVLHRCGELYPDKPPLLYWIAAALGSVSAWSPAVMRWVSLFSMAVCAMTTRAFALRWWSAREAAWAPVFFLGMALVAEIGGRLQIDPLLAACCVAALFQLARPAPDTATANRSWMLAGALAGAGALAKGPVAFVNVGLPWLAISIVARRQSGGAPKRKRASKSAVAAALVLALGPVLVWALAASWVEPALLRPLFFGQHLERAVEGTAHAGPPWQNLLRMPLQMLPWTALVLLGAWQAWKTRRASSAGPQDRGSAQALAWFAALFVFFSVIPAKRDLYLLCAYPAAALLAARWLALAIDSPRRRLWPAWSHAALSACVAAVLAALPLLKATEAFDPKLLAARPLLAAVPFALGAAWVAVLARRRDLGGAMRAATASWCASLLAVGLALPPALDGWKSARELGLALAARPEKPREIPCFGVQPEGYRFYGRVPAVLGKKGSGGQALLEALERDGDDCLVLIVEENFERLPVETRARFAVVQRQRVGSRQVCVLGKARG